MMPTPKEKDFGMYVEGPTNPSTETPEVTPAADATPSADATPTADAMTTPETQNADLEQVAKEVGGAPAADATPADATPSADGTPPTPDAGTPADGTTPKDDVNGDELQKMLDTLTAESQAGNDSIDKVATAIEKAKENIPETDTETKKLLDSALAENATLKANQLKSDKTIEVLSSEYEKTLKDKISLEYGTASDSKIATLVNEDPDVKALIAAKLASGDGAKEKLIQARKAGRENTSGTSVDALIAGRKADETSALGGGEDASSTVGKPGEKMYV